jgi:DNA polymerase III delta subunit
MPIFAIKSKYNSLTIAKIDEIKAQLLAVNPDATILNVYKDTFNAPGDLANEFLPSLFSEPKLIIAKNFDAFPKEFKDEVATVLKDIDLSTSFVFSYSNSNLVKSLLTNVKKTGATMIEISEISKPNEVKVFINQTLQAKGKSADAGAVNYLIETFGDEIDLLSGFIDQLSFDIDTPQVSLVQVKQYYSSIYTVNIFELIDAILEGNKPVALDLAKKAVDNGTSAVQVFVLLNNKLSGIADVLSIKAKEPSDDKPNAWMLKQSEKFLSSFDQNRLKSFSNKLFIAYKDFLNNSLDDYLVLEKLILDNSSLRGTK